MSVDVPDRVPGGREPSAGRDAADGGPFVSEQVAGRSGATMHFTEHGPGDWSSPPGLDLKLTVARKAQGHTIFDLGAGRFEGHVRAEEWTLVAPRTATTIYCDGRHSLSILAIPYRRLLSLAGDAGLPADGDFGILHSRLNRNTPVTQLVTALGAESRAGSPRGSLYADGALLQLASRLLGLRSPRPTSASTLTSPLEIRDPRIRRAAEFLLANLTADVGLSDLARLTGLSPRHFTRAFYEATGVPPHRWLINRRVERGCLLLSAADSSITDIAYACGFSSSQHFATVFKSVMGVTPTQYRRSSR